VLFVHLYVGEAVGFKVGFLVSGPGAGGAGGAVTGSKNMNSNHRHCNRRPILDVPPQKVIPQSNNIAVVASLRKAKKGAKMRISQKNNAHGMVS